MKKINTHKDYIIDGIEYPSVTNIIKLLNKEGLVYWANSLGFRRLNVDKVLEEKAEIGTYVHYLCECLVTNTTPVTYNSRNKYMIYEVRKRFNSFNQYYNNHKLEPLFTEKSIISKSMGYAGTCDYMGYLDGKLTIIDYKTSKSFYSSMYIQLGGYSLLYKELGYSAEQFAILLIHENECVIKIIDDIEILKYEDIFKSLLNLYKELGDIK